MSPTMNMVDALKTTGDNLKAASASIRRAESRQSCPDVARDCVTPNRNGRAMPVIHSSES